MKKLISLILILCTMSVLLVSCGEKMEDFTNNLAIAGYVVEEMPKKEFEAMLEEIYLDPDDYGIENVAIVGTYKPYGRFAIIVECGSRKEAKELSEDSDIIAASFEMGFSQEFRTDCNFESVHKGKFVLIGDSTSIDIALER